MEIKNELNVVIPDLHIASQFIVYSRRSTTVELLSQTTDIKVQRRSYCHIQLELINDVKWPAGARTRDIKNWRKNLLLLLWPS